MEAQLMNNIICVAVIISIAGIILFDFLRSDQEINKSLADSLGASVVPFFSRPPHIKGNYEGFAFEVTFSQTRYHGIQEPRKGLRINLYHDFIVQLNIFSNLNDFIDSAVLDRFMNRNPGLKKMPPHFSELEYSIYANDADAAKTFLRSEQIKQAIGGLFGAGFSMISISEKRIYVNSNYFRGNVYDPGSIRAVLKRLCLIAKG